MGTMGQGTYLTLTNVVFEFLMLYIHLNNILYLTLTNVVFEYLSDEEKAFVIAI